MWAIDGTNWLIIPSSSTHPHPLRSQEIDAGNAFAKTRLTQRFVIQKRNRTSDWLTVQETLLWDMAVRISRAPTHSLYQLDIV
jgi:hypothetical protein